jgi:hypothetical protein
MDLMLLHPASKINLIPHDPQLALPACKEGATFWPQETQTGEGDLPVGTVG